MKPIGVLQELLYICIYNDIYIYIILVYFRKNCVGLETYILPGIFFLKPHFQNLF